MMLGGKPNCKTGVGEKTMSERNSVRKSDSNIETD